MKSNRLEILPSVEPTKNKIDEEHKDENQEEKKNCNKYCEGFSTISSKIQLRTFILYTVVSIGILISRIFYISQVSDELDQYGLNYEIKYRLIDFQKTTDLFFSNFDYLLNESKHALDVINDLSSIAKKIQLDDEKLGTANQKYQFNYDDFEVCHMKNVTDCVRTKKDEEITYKLRTDAFYKIYYFLTSSIYVLDEDEEGFNENYNKAPSPTEDQKKKKVQFHISKISYKENQNNDQCLFYNKYFKKFIYLTSIIEKFYFNVFQHFHFPNNLHHKMFMVFPKALVARIFPVQYNSSDDNSKSADSTSMKAVLGGTNPHWVYGDINQYKAYSNIYDYSDEQQQTFGISRQQILRITRSINENKDIYGNDDIGGIVSIDIFYSHLNSTFSHLLGSNFNTYFIHSDGTIIQTNIENFTEKSIFSALQGCFCDSVINKLKIDGEDISASCLTQTTQYTKEDCQYFNMKGLWSIKDDNKKDKFMFYIITVRDNNYTTENSNKLIFTIIYVYLSLFLCLFIAIIYITRKTIEEYTTDITNPIRQISFKIQRIMHNIFNPKQFSKIRTDEIVIREKTEIRKLANKFGETFQRLNEKNLFQTTIVSSIDKSYQKSKEISDKPSKDTIVDEVRNIVQAFLDDQQTAINDQQQQQERNKYSRSNNKSRNNLDASLLRE